MIYIIWIHLLSSIEITKDFNYEPSFNGLVSRDNLPRINDEAYVISLEDKQSKETHCLSLFNDRNTSVYFDFFGIEYIHEEVLSETYLE